MDTRRLFIEFAKEINDCQGWSINSDAQYLAVMAALEASAAEIAALKAALERNELSMDKELALKYAELQAQNNTLRWHTQTFHRPECGVRHGQRRIKLWNLNSYPKSRLRK